MEEREPIIIDVQIDETGNWQAELEEELETGSHAVIATTEDGQEDRVFFSIQETVEPSVIEKVRTEISTNVPGFIIFFSLLLLLLVILLLLNNLRLRKKINRLLDKIKGLRTHNDEMKVQEEPEQLEVEKKKPSIKKVNLVLYILIALVSLAGIISLFSYFDVWERVGLVSKEEKMLAKLSGTVMRPFTLTGVRNVDLTVGDTSIKTNEGGKYIFSNVSSRGVIRITHPNLAKALFKKIEGKQEMDIYFDEEMYNTLTFIIDYESRKKFADIFENYLHPDLKIRLSKNNFIENKSTIFTGDNIADQELFITKVELFNRWNSEISDEKFNRVVEILVEANNQQSSYFLSKTENGWKQVF
ncbi:MAG: hypothetical protein GF349_01500 [Candidatus Magasanikbacteria bacterium]|nr:hypothetical protein [Candidatus Magasanikbacteria bacterium]